MITWIENVDRKHVSNRKRGKHKQKKPGQQQQTYIENVSAIEDLSTIKSINNR